MTTFKANRKFPNPATVTDDPKSHTLALQQIIEALNVGQRRTKEVMSSYVRVHELVDVGLVEIVGNQLKLTNTGAAAVASTPGASALADLTDVDLTGLADGDVLSYDLASGTWVVGPPSTGVTPEALTPYIGRSLYPARPSSPNSLDDEFDTTLDTTTKWTVRFGSAANGAITAHGLRLTGALAMTQPISGSAWSFEARFLTKDLDTFNGIMFLFGRTASNTALYGGGFFKNGGYPFFYSATLPLSGGWTATSALASSTPVYWFNHAKMMNHRVTLASGTLTYLIGEDSAPESYRAPYSNNTIALSSELGGDCDCIGLYHVASGPSLVEYFRRLS